MLRRGMKWICCVVYVVLLGHVSASVLNAGDKNCTQVKCKYYSKCEMRNGTASCVCPTFCIESHAPVCGSDGKTYSNDCHLKVHACKLQEDIKVNHKGSCKPDPCSKANCEFYSECIPGGNGTVSCVCPTPCTFQYSPVCGTDGKTYKNECFMKVASCSQKKIIQRKHHEVCERSGTCPVIRKNCGSIQQLCHLDESCPGFLKCCQTEACALNCTVPILDPCPECTGKGQYCWKRENNGSVYCKPCPQSCSLKAVPKCGSDGKTYVNQCLFDMANCKTGGNLKIDHHGTCRQMRRQRKLLFGLLVGFGIIIAIAVLVGAYFVYRRFHRKRGDDVQEMPFLDK